MRKEAFPMGIATFPVTVVKIITRKVTTPTGKVIIPVRIATFPVTVVKIITRKVTTATGKATFPVTIVTIPVGIAAIPKRKGNFPLRKAKILMRKVTIPHPINAVCKVYIPSSCLILYWNILFKNIAICTDNCSFLSCTSHMQFCMKILRNILVSVIGFLFS